MHTDAETGKQTLRHIDIEKETEREKERERDREGARGGKE